MIPFTCDWWVDVLARFGLTILGGTIAAFIGYRFAVLSDRRKAKQEFSVVISQARDWVTSKAESPAAIWMKSFDKLAGGYYQFRTRISDRQRLRLDKVWKRYSQMKEDELAPVGLEFGKEYGVPVLPNDPHEKPRKRILDLLDEMLAFTK